MRIKYSEFENIVENVFQSMQLISLEIDKQYVEDEVEKCILNEGYKIEPINIIEEIKDLDKEFIDIEDSSQIYINQREENGLNKKQIEKQY
jgi:hypothetical protein